jgi:hypothetical protein
MDLALIHLTTAEIKKTAMNTNSRPIPVVRDANECSVVMYPNTIWKPFSESVYPIATPKHNTVKY